jgi:AcrR family transcriptional regulator
LYRHFPDLDHLRAEVAAAARAELARRLLAARDAVPRRRTRLDRARAELVATGTAYIRFAVDEPRLFATAFAPTGTAVSPDEDPNAWGVLTDVVDALDAAGGIDSRRRADAAFVAWSAVHGTATILVGALQPTGRSDVSIDRAVDAVTAAVVRALAT